MTSSFVFVFWGDDRWNCSARFGTNTKDAVIRHFHGRAHIRHNGAREIWLPHLRAALLANAAGLRDWAGSCDGRVGKLAANEQAR